MWGRRWRGEACKSTRGLSRAAPCCNPPGWGPAQLPSRPRVSHSSTTAAWTRGLPCLAPGITCHVGQLRGLQAIQGLPVLLGLRPKKRNGDFLNIVAEPQPQSPCLGHLPELYPDRGTEELRAARMELAQPSHTHHCYPQFIHLGASSGLQPSKLSPTWASRHSPQHSSDPAGTKSCPTPPTKTGLSPLPGSMLGHQLQRYRYSRRAPCQLLVLRGLHSRSLLLG